VTTDEVFADAGFELVQTRRGGERQYARRVHPYLSYWALARPDGLVELSWEVELGAYLKQKGFAISVQDELSLLLFPTGEVSGPIETAWLVEEMGRIEERLGSVDLRTGT
jgi:hypothetical protein